MFAQDLYHSQINILEMLSTYNEKTERSLRLVEVIRLRLGERYNKSSIVNIQFRLVRVGIRMCNPVKSCEK